MAAILIVEDDVNAARHLGERLTAEGHSCVHESRGKKALESAKEHSFDLMVLDVMLPDISGFEVCRTIRRDSSLYTMPIIMISVMDHEEEIIHGLSQGADDYVAKPFSIQDFLTRVSALLQASATGGETDEMTGLSSSEATKREMQRRISCEETFSVIYVEIINLREFAYSSGPEARLKAFRHATRAIKRSGDSLEIENFFAGHLGGGHFVCLMSADRVESFCDLLLKTWGNHMKTFYETIGQESIFENAAGGDEKAEAKMLRLLCCVTTQTGRQRSTPKTLFEVLSHIRKKSGDNKAGGIIFDKRAFTDPPQST